MKLYVASRTRHAGVWRDLRDGKIYVHTGCQIISTWIDEDEPGQTASMSELWQRIENEVKTADGLLLYIAPGDLPVQGALVEVGMALGAGLEVIVVLQPRTLNPAELLGSWVHHPLVKVVDTVWEAIGLAIKFTELSRYKCAACNSLYTNCRCNDGGEGDAEMRRRARQRADAAGGVAINAQRI